MRSPGSRCFIRLLLVSPVALLAGPARAADCSSTDVRYSASNNRVYVTGEVECTLSRIAVLAPKADLELVDAATQTWLLGSDIVLEEGATLQLYGSDSGGDVDELRLRSDSDGFVEIRAQWGGLDIRDTTVMSWDSSADGPDTEVSDGRAYIRVISYLEDDGVTARESRMDVADSDLGYLGYDGTEAYGVTWKVRTSAESDFDLVEVYGDVTGSTLHDNYYGAYTYGASDMTWSDNTIEQNIVYGLDPHDDSDGLTIEGNTFQDNGSHGFICSKRCDGLVIRENTSSYNGGIGFMLHDSVTDSIIEYNTADYNVDDAGISLFDSHDNTIRYNTIRYNLVGIRVVSGASENTIDGNTVAYSTKYGVELYQDSDDPGSGDGRPSDNTITDNTISGSGEYGIKIADADDNVLQGNTLRANGAGLLADEGEPSGNLVQDNTFRSNGEFAIKLDGAVDTTLSGNEIDDHDTGVYLLRSTGVSVSDNAVSDCGAYGIRLAQSAGNTVESNTVASSNKGISLEDDSDENTVSSNAIAAVSSYGILIADARDNVFEGNTFDESELGYYYVEGNSDNVVLDSDLVELKLADTDSSMDIADDRGRVFATSVDVPTTVSSDGSLARVTGHVSDELVSFEAVSLQVVPVGGELTVRVRSWDDGGSVYRRWSITEGTAKAASFVVGELDPGTRYDVYVNGVRVRTATADATHAVRLRAIDPAGRTYLLVEAD